MTQYARVATAADASVAYVQSADAEDLQNKINFVIAALPDLTVITALTLFGAGDGHTFGCLIEIADVSDVIGGLPGATSGVPRTEVRCYLAGSADRLLAARLAAGTPTVGTIPIWNLVDEQMSGSSAGTRMMGMSVYSTGAVAEPGTPFALVQAQASPQALAGGENLVIFEASANLQQFSQPASAVVQYTGSIARLFVLDASVTVEQDAANDVVVEIVFDPIGTPIAVAPRVLTHVAAGEFDNVSVPSLLVLSPSAVSVAGSKVGVRVTAGGVGQIKSAALRISPVG